MIVYMAGPIDDLDPMDADGWREQLAQLLIERGLVAFFPNRCYAVPSMPDQATKLAVIHLNKHVIYSCLAVIANLNGPGRGIGTIREIETARSMGKPVIVIGRNIDQHFALADVEIVDSILSAAESASALVRHINAEFKVEDND